MHSRFLVGGLRVRVCGFWRAGAVARTAFAGRWVLVANRGSKKTSESARPRHGESMPDGIDKTNGRLEATQVDVAAKYPGRLTDITVEEGSEVKAGQVVGRVSSPEYEAQLRAAESNVDKAEQALVEAETLITSAKPCWPPPNPISSADRSSSANRSSRNRPSTSVAATSKASEASVAGAIAQRDQAEAAIKSAQAEVERIEAILKDLVLVSPRTGRVQYQLARNGEVVAGRRQGADHPRPAGCVHDRLLAGSGRRQARHRRRSPHHPRPSAAIGRSGQRQLCCRRRAVHPEDRRDFGRARKTDVSR